MEHLFSRYGAIGVFLGAAMEGQTAVVLGGFLARQHLMALWLVLLSASAGSAIFDHLLFEGGRRFRSNRLIVRATQQPTFAKALRFLERFPLSYILAFRFLYGLRLVSPIAIGVSKVPAWRFAVLNVLAAILWATTFTALGYLFGGTLEVILGGREARRWALIVGGVGATILLLVGVAWKRSRRRKIQEQSAE